MGAFREALDGHATHTAPSNLQSHTVKVKTEFVDKPTQFVSVEFPPWMPPTRTPSGGPVPTSPTTSASPSAPCPRTEPVSRCRPPTRPSDAPTCGSPDGSSSGTPPDPVTVDGHPTALQDEPSLVFMPSTMNPMKWFSSVAVGWQTFVTGVPP